MPAIADFSELVLAVGEHLNNANLVDVMPRFVAMAESKLNRVLRLRDQEVVEVLTPDLNGMVALPDGFLEAKSVATTGTPPIILRAMGADNAARQYIGGNPVGYLIQGGSMIIAPPSQRDIRLAYYAEIPPLEAAQSNWLLAKHPDLYLYAVAYEACVYLADPARSSLVGDLVGGAIRAAQRADQLSRVSQSRLRFARAVP